MGSINLSQSIQEKQALARGKFFDKGFFINVTIFLIVAGGYGFSIWYLGRLEGELLALQTNSADKTLTLKGPEVNRAVDIRERIDAASLNQAASPSPRTAFSDLEKVTLSTIQIWEYHRIEEDQAIVIRGMTESLRYLAQQMLAFKQLEYIQMVHVEEVKYNKETRKIDFELTLTLKPAVTEEASSNGSAL
ncbi:MAG: hypothetical protein ACEQSB_05360 [Undibacterium sp.]